MTPADFTPDQLREGWQRVRRRSWPGTFEACMADPIISRIIMIAVRHGIVPFAAEPVRPRQQGRPASTKPVFDRKRLAAGEREDD